jgi:hypothetical protein
MFDKVFFIGAGGTGSMLLPVIIRSICHNEKTKDASFTIIDGDDFESKNMSRQFMIPDWEGKNKATSMLMLCQYMGFNNVTAIEDFVDKESFISLLDESLCPLIIATVDNNPTRCAILTAIEEVCETKDFFFCTPGNSDVTQDPKGQVMWWGQINGQKYGQNPKEYDPDIRNPQEQLPRKGSCMLHQESHPQLISVNFSAANHTLSLIQELLDEQLNPKHSQIHFNNRTHKTTIS